MVDGIGLSVGATNLTAVVVRRAAVTRSPVLTLYPHRAPEVGVPSENPNLTEPGLIITDFVDRVGDPVGILASDGSSHRGETLVADALGALLRALTRGRPADDPIAITHPAHWRPNQVDALRSACASVPEFAAQPTVVSDAVAALSALQDDPGVPTRGVIALCDFGGSGSSITLADAADGYRPIAPTVRHPDLSGDLIDQTILTRVVNDLAAAGTIDLASTSAIGSLSRLRGECRRAKERLSTDSVTALAVELPAHRTAGASGATGRTEVRLNRNELDEAIREPLAEFVGVLHDTIDRSGLRPGDLVAVATMGGGARIPAITTTLSEHFQVPVITAPQPELTAAIGGGLTAVRGSAVEGATALAPAVSPATQAAPVMAPEPPPVSQALAWSDVDDIPDVEPVGYDSDYDEPGGRTTARPQLQFSEPEPIAHAAALPWYRKPAVALGVGAAAVLAVVGAAVFLANRGEPMSTSGTVTSTTSPTQQPAAPAEQRPADEASAQQQETVTQQAPSARTVTQTEQPPAEAPPPAQTPPPTTEAPPPTSEAPPPAETPPPTSAAPQTTQAPWSPTAPYPTIPGLPWVPAPGGGHRG